MRGAIVGLAVFLLSASGAEAGYTMMGVGTASCAKFNEQYAKNPGLAEPMFFSWAQGFISGMNEILLHDRARTKNMQSISLADQQTGLRNYCRSHPTAMFQTAVKALFVALATNPAEPPPPKH